MKKVFVILLALCAFSVVLSGCGGGSSDAPADKPVEKPADETK